MTRLLALAFQRVFWQTSRPPPMPLFNSAPPSFRLWPAALAFAALSACSGQGEGELCSPNAGNHGNDDCQDGLICVTSPTYLLGRCCPQDRSQATTTVCSSNSGGLGDANPAPPDASAEETPPAEASTDASIENSAETGAGSDASDATTE
jgi:hypothetical protein